MDYCRTWMVTTKHSYICQKAKIMAERLYVYVPYLVWRVIHVASNVQPARLPKWIMPAVQLGGLQDNFVVSPDP